jgi:hypothetical protein
MKVSFKNCKEKKIRDFGSAPKGDFLVHLGKSDEKN